LPLGFSQGARVVQELSTAVVLGNWDTNSLAAVAVSTIWSDVCSGPWQAGVSQLSALCSRAYASGEHRELGSWLQAFLAFSTLLCLPIAGLRLLTRPVLMSFGIEASLAANAQVYTVWTMPSLPFEVWYFAVKELHASRFIVLPDAVVDVVFIAVRVTVTWAFVFRYEWGMRGAALALVVTNAARLLVYIAYTWCVGLWAKVWSGWSFREMFHRDRWCVLLALTTPAIFAGFVEKIQFLFSGVLAGASGAADAAALTLVCNLTIIALVVGMAGGDVVAVRMARFLAEGRPMEARFTTKVGVYGYTIGSLVTGPFFCWTMEIIADTVSYDDAVRSKLIDMRWSVGAAIPACITCLFCAAVLTRQGRGPIVASRLPLCCWVCGFPLSYWLSRNLQPGAPGVWEGVVIGYGLAAVALLIPCCRTDWVALSETMVRERESSTLSAASVQGLGVSLQQPEANATP
jgi:MATE family multidrug resistance protein